jgi:hypothetical protein
MKTKKTLKLTLETVRRLDLDAATGGVYHQYTLGGSCGIACTIGPNRPQTQYTHGGSCGIVCTIGPNRPKPTMRSLGASCGIICF